MLGLLLPAGHPVWTDAEQPLPIETADVTRVLAAPGWLVSARRRDGITVVLNHGTDHAKPGDQRTDSPLYARLGYSTATVPPLTGDSMTDPLDNSVVLLDESGRSGPVSATPARSNSARCNRPSSSSSTGRCDDYPR